MKVMLDTNICIYLIKQQPPSILERFLSHPVGDIGISSVTATELAYGVTKSRHVTKNRHALEQVFDPLEVAAFDQAAALASGSSVTISRSFDASPICGLKTGFKNRAGAHCIFDVVLDVTLSSPASSAVRFA